MIPGEWAKQVIDKLNEDGFWVRFGVDGRHKMYVRYTRTQQFRAWLQDWRFRFRDCWLILRGTHYAERDE